MVFVVPCGNALPEMNAKGLQTPFRGLFDTVASKQHKYPNPWQQHFGVPEQSPTQVSTRPTVAKLQCFKDISKLG